MKPALYKLLQKAGWAPLAVVILHAVIIRSPFRKPFDFSIHFLGGAAAAYFAFHLLECFAFLLGTPSRLGRLLSSFTLACTVGLFWEFAEFLGDAIRHSHVQMSLHETMSDLIADATGGATCLCILYVIFRNRRAAPITP